MEKEQFVLTQDTSSILSAIDPRFDAEANPHVDQAVTEYWNTIQKEVALLTAGSVDIVAHTEEAITRRLSEKLASIYEENENAICICLDRFLLGEYETEEYADRFFRFSMCRSQDGQKVPRQGSPGFLEQLYKIHERADLNMRDIVVIDDGYFTGKTIKEFITIAQSNGIRPNIVETIGFVGTTQAQSVEGTDIPCTVLAPIKRLYEWVDIRDFSIFGGKLYQTGSCNRASSSIPYLYPWSEGAGASIDMSPYLYEGSINMIVALNQLIEAYEGKRGKKITFHELIENNFPFPTNEEKTIPVTLGMNATDYLDCCVGLIKSEQQRPVALFDRTTLPVVREDTEYIDWIQATNPNTKLVLLTSQEDDPDEFSNRFEKRYVVGTEGRDTAIAMITGRYQEDNITFIT